MTRMSRALEPSASASLSRVEFSTATASLSPTASWRSGKLTPAANTPTPTTLRTNRSSRASRATAAFPRMTADVFASTTIKPGRVPGPDGPGAAATLQAPHLAVSVFTCGLLRRLIIRIYFPDEPSNRQDFALGLVDPARRTTLIANKIDGRTNALEWNVVHQGPGETVFFDF
jgi:hypothetical protein